MSVFLLLACCYVFILTNCAARARSSRARQVCCGPRLAATRAWRGRAATLSATRALTLRARWVSCGSKSAAMRARWGPAGWGGLMRRSRRRWGGRIRLGALRFQAKPPEADENNRRFQLSCSRTNWYCRGWHREICFYKIRFSNERTFIIFIRIACCFSYLNTFLGCLCAALKQQYI